MKNESVIDFLTIYFLVIAIGFLTISMFTLMLMYKPIIHGVTLFLSLLELVLSFRTSHVWERLDSKQRKRHILILIGIPIVTLILL